MTERDYQMTVKEFIDQLAVSNCAFYCGTHVITFSKEWGAQYEGLRDSVKLHDGDRMKYQGPNDYLVILREAGNTIVTMEGMQIVQWNNGYEL